jgi:hypothetical protein
MFSENFFYKNWLNTENKTEDNKDILISYNLALENIEDFQYINLNKKNLELIEVKKLITFKNVQNYAFLLIYFTADEFRAYIKTTIANKEIDKSFNLKIYANDEIKTYQEAIKIIKEEVSQIWKSQNLVDVNTPSFLNLYLDSKKANDYLKLRAIFDSIDLIENYSVLEMRNKYLKVRIKYKGRINRLRDKLAENKVNIKIIDNIWRATVN